MFFIERHFTFCVKKWCLGKTFQKNIKQFFRIIGKQLFSTKLPFSANYFLADLQLDARLEENIKLVSKRSFLSYDVNPMKSVHFT